MDLKM